MLPDCHATRRRWRQSVRWRWEEELDGCCRSKLGMIVKAQRATDSSALPSAKARTSRVTSTTNFFPTAPSGIEKRFGRQRTASWYASFTADTNVSPCISSPHMNAGEEERWKSGKVALRIRQWSSLEKDGDEAGIVAGRSGRSLEVAGSSTDSGSLVDVTPPSLVWCACASVQSSVFESLRSKPPNWGRKELVVVVLVII